MTLKADLDMLIGLGSVLHRLADRAGAEQVTTGTLGPDSLVSVHAAAHFSHRLLNGDLVPAVEARLRDTGDAMIGVAAAYRDSDDAHARNLADCYRDAVGTWTDTAS